MCFYYRSYSVCNAVCLLRRYILCWKLASTHVLKLQGCRYNANFSVVEAGKALKQTPTKSIYSADRSTCARQCLVDSTCHQFNFKRTSGTCEFLEFLYVPKPDAKNGWEFVRTDTYLRNVRKFFKDVFFYLFVPYIVNFFLHPPSMLTWARTFNQKQPLCATFKAHNSVELSF